MKTMSQCDYKHLVFSKRQSTLGPCQPIWKSRCRYSWRNYPESSVCSLQWTDPYGLRFSWLNLPELPVQRGGLWSIIPEGRGRCYERSRWSSPPSSPWSPIGWELKEKQKRQQCEHLMCLRSLLLAKVFCRQFSAALHYFFLLPLPPYKGKCDTSISGQNQVKAFIWCYI